MIYGSPDRISPNGEVPCAVLKCGNEEICFAKRKKILKFQHFGIGAGILLEEGLRSALLTTKGAGHLAVEVEVGAQRKLSLQRKSRRQPPVIQQF